MASQQRQGLGVDKSNVTSSGMNISNVPEPFPYLPEGDGHKTTFCGFLVGRRRERAVLLWLRLDRPLFIIIAAVIF